jgi:hypothetical protein
MLRTRSGHRRDVTDFFRDRPHRFRVSCGEQKLPDVITSQVTSRSLVTTRPGKRALSRSHSQRAPSSLSPPRAIRPRGIPSPQIAALGWSVPKRTSGQVPAKMSADYSGRATGDRGPPRARRRLEAPRRHESDPDPNRPRSKSTTLGGSGIVPCGVTVIEMSPLALG